MRSTEIWPPTNKTPRDASPGTAAAKTKRPPKNSAATDHPFQPHTRMHACIQYTNATRQTPPAQLARSPHRGHAPRTREPACTHRPMTIPPMKLRTGNVSPKNGPPRKRKKQKSAWKKPQFQSSGLTSSGIEMGQVVDANRHCFGEQTPQFGIGL